MARGHLQEMRGAASREIQHNAELQNFYNKRDNLAIENTKFRGETEYKRLMGEAKEYEKNPALKGKYGKMNATPIFTHIYLNSEVYRSESR